MWNRKTVLLPSFMKKKRIFFYWIYNKKGINVKRAWKIYFIQVHSKRIRVRKKILEYLIFWPLSKNFFFLFQILLKEIIRKCINFIKQPSQLSNYLHLIVCLKTFINNVLKLIFYSLDHIVYNSNLYISYLLLKTLNINLFSKKN